MATITRKKILRSLRQNQLLHLLQHRRQDQLLHLLNQVTKEHPQQHLLRFQNPLTRNSSTYSYSSGTNNPAAQPSNQYPDGYGTRIDAPEGAIFTRDFRDSDGDGIDDRHQPGPGQPDPRFAGDKLKGTGKGGVLPANSQSEPTVSNAIETLRGGNERAAMDQLRQIVGLQPMTDQEWAAEQAKKADNPKIVDQYKDPSTPNDPVPPVTSPPTPAPAPAPTTTPAPVPSPTITSNINTNDPSTTTVSSPTTSSNTNTTTIGDTSIGGYQGGNTEIKTDINASVGPSTTTIDNSDKPLIMKVHMVALTPVKLKIILQYRLAQVKLRLEVSAQAQVAHLLISILQAAAMFKAMSLITLLSLTTLKCLIKTKVELISLIKVQPRLTIMQLLQLA